MDDAVFFSIISTIVSITAIVASSAVSIYTLKSSNRNLRYAALIEKKTDAINKFIICANSMLLTDSVEMAEINSLVSVINIYLTGSARHYIGAFIEVLNERRDVKLNWEYEQQKTRATLSEPPICTVGLSCTNFYDLTEKARRILDDISNELRRELRNDAKQGMRNR